MEVQEPTIGAQDREDEHLRCAPTEHAPDTHGPYRKAVVMESQLLEQLRSLHLLSVEIAALHDLADVYDQALTHGLALTGSPMGFIGLLDDERGELDIVGMKGFEPTDPTFYTHFRRMPVRPSVFGVTITEERSTVSNDVALDPNRVGQPPGHPPVETFLGVPLRVGTTVIGMMGVANKAGGYNASDERLLSTFANQVAGAIDNARLYEHQREMIASLEDLHQRLGDKEADELIRHERERIAAELHDDILQDIFTAGLRLGSLLDRQLEPSTAHELLGTRQLVVRAADRMRDVVFALASGSPTNAGLTAAVRALLSETRRTTGLETDLHVGGVESDAVTTIQDVVYSVVKEALANVVKHARARTVLVSIRYDDKCVDVVIQDDGTGASDLMLRRLHDSYLHFGLRNMRHQILERSGTFEVTNGEEGGLMVRASVPLSARPA
jgi:signal transduction histidine kinase